MINVDGQLNQARQDSLPRGLRKWPDSDFWPATKSRGIIEQSGFASETEMSNIVESPRLVINKNW